jgi:glutathione synthase/RimK-type ligase-like ATP-grasp enzyme
MAEITVGIYTEQDYKKDNRFYLLNSLARDRDIDIFYFGNENVDLLHSKINGFCFDGDKIVQKMFDYPDIVEPVGVAMNKVIKKELSQVSVFPTTGLLGDKKYFIYVLGQIGCEKYQIPTFDFNVDDFSKLLKKYKSLIIKPNNSFGGNNVHKITATAGGVSILRPDHTVTEISNAKFKKETAPQFDNYIVQPYYDFSTDSGNPFDIRVVSQRGENGKWKMINSSLAVRVGHSMGCVSNIHSGGFLVTGGVKSFLEMNTVANVNEVLAEVKRIATFLPNKIQRGYVPFISTIAFDIGVTKNGEIKIMEINSTPTLFLNFCFEIFSAKTDNWRYLFSNKIRLLSRQIKKVKKVFSLE